MVFNMKKLLLFVLALIVFLPLSAQLEVSYHKDVKYLRITDEYKKVLLLQGNDFKSSNKKEFDVLFEVVQENPSDKNFKYFLVLEYKTYDDELLIPDNGKLLLKTGTGEVIHLTNELYGDGWKYATIFDPENVTLTVTALPSKSPIYHHPRPFPLTGYEDYYIIRARYFLPMEDIEKICQDGVVKLRIQTNFNSIDIDLPAQEKFKIGNQVITNNKFAQTMKDVVSSARYFLNPTSWVE